jgi:predicted RNA binding protein YcfA (HicA-like mRNA interferase family)
VVYTAGRLETIRPTASRPLSRRSEICRAAAPTANTLEAAQRKSKRAVLLYRKPDKALDEILVIVANISGVPTRVRNVIRRLREDGWILVTTRGSYCQFKHAIKPRLVTVPGRERDELK